MLQPCEGAESPAAEPPLLPEGKRISGLSKSRSRVWSTFRASVPKDAVLMTVRLTQCAVPLDILARKDGPLTRLRTPRTAPIPMPLETTLLISRQSIPPLEEGSTVGRGVRGHRFTRGS